MIWFKKRFEIGLGCYPDPIDERDYKIEEVLKAFPPFDWEKGFDIEEKMGQKIIIKNQGNSGSCVGQAWAYYAGILEAFEIKKYKDFSARWLYSQIYLPEGGSYLRLGGQKLIDQGIVPSVLFPDFRTEETMRVFDPTKDLESIAKIYLKGTYLLLPTDNIDHLASVIELNNGFVSGVSDDFTIDWGTPFPKPGCGTSEGHALYFGKAKKINGKKYLGFPNSWGEGVGDKGWQWLEEKWITSGRLYNPRTLMDLPSEVDRIATKPEFEFQRNLGLGLKNDDDVSKLQECLTWLGMYPKEVHWTGNFYGITLEAVKLFQATHQLEISEIVGYNIGRTGFVGLGTRTVLNKIFA